MKQTNKKQKKINYFQVGDITKCGHCDDRFKEGLEQVEKLGIKCECKCHSMQNKSKEGKELGEQVFILPNIGTAQEFISEFLNVLEEYNNNFSTHSMNDSALYKQGEKYMLEQVIKLLKKEIAD